MPSLIKPKKGGSGIGSGREEMDVLIESDERGDVRRVKSVEFLGDGVRVEPFDKVRRGKEKGLGGEEDRFVGVNDWMVGDDTGDICFGDCVGVVGRDGL